MGPSGLGLTWMGCGLGSGLTGLQRNDVQRRKHFRINKMGIGISVCNTDLVYHKINSNTNGSSVNISNNTIATDDRCSPRIFRIPAFIPTAVIFHELLSGILVILRLWL